VTRRRRRNSSAEANQQCQRCDERIGTHSSAFPWRRVKDKGDQNRRQCPTKAPNTSGVQKTLSSSVSCVKTSVKSPASEAHNAVRSEYTYDGTPGEATNDSSLVPASRRDASIREARLSTSRHLTAGRWGQAGRMHG
jgi:hypothetical protein